MLMRNSAMFLTRHADIVGTVESSLLGRIMVVLGSEALGKWTTADRLREADLTI